MNNEIKDVDDLEIEAENVEELELEEAQSTEEVLRSIEMGKAFEKMKNTKEFKLVIEEGYLKNNVLNSVSLLAVPNYKKDRPQIIEDIICTSNLSYYFSMIVNDYKIAVQNSKGTH